MTALPGGSTKSLSQKALPQLVLDLAGKLESFEQELSELRTHNQALQEEVERLRLDNGNLHARNQALKDEIAPLHSGGRCNLCAHPTGLWARTEHCCGRENGTLRVPAPPAPLAPEPMAGLRQ